MGTKEGKPTFDWRNTSGILWAAGLAWVITAHLEKLWKLKVELRLTGEMQVETRETPMKHRLNISGLAKRWLKRRLRYKASGHCLDPHLIGASWVKIGKMLLWRWMSVVYLVFFTAPAADQHLANLHLRFAGALLILPDEILSL
ncbi:hypothetical protein HAX54_009463 [Datura stramonium]|uniref:Uncharacterized protein n=1 Tax=Datura stramonium TaxID=4076 RepID=A0ABS8TGJ5_DATST|nr:hypothetical protein [Datura stramonium]